MKYNIIIFTILLLLIPCYAGAEIPTETHAILQKIAQSTMKTVTAKGKFSIKVPDYWETRDGSNGGIAFTDPGNRAVVGAVYAVDASLNHDALPSELKKLFNTSFNIIEKSDNVSVGEVSGSVLTLEGRIGGEQSRIYASLLKVGDGRQFVVILEMPEYWASSYKPCFDDIWVSVRGN